MAGNVSKARGDVTKIDQSVHHHFDAKDIKNLPIVEEKGEAIQYSEALERCYINSLGVTNGKSDVDTYKFAVEGGNTYFVTGSYGYGAVPLYVTANNYEAKSCDFNLSLDIELTQLIDYEVTVPEDCVCLYVHCALGHECSVHKKVFKFEAGETALKEEVKEKLRKSHSHDNKEELDKIQPGNVEAWNNKADLENGKLKSEQLPVETVTRTGNYFGEAGNIPVVSGASAVTDSGVNIADVEKTENKNAANGYAGLDKYNLIDKSHIPSEYVKVYGGEFVRENNIPVVQSGNVIKDSGTSINDVATKGFVEQKVAGLVNSAPEALDTLSELAKALGNDEEFAANVTKEIAKKADSEQVAKGIAEAKEEAVNDAKEYSDTAILNQESKEHALLSNALKGTASGEIITLSDVSSVEHEVGCVVRSKNLIAYPYLNNSYEKKGVTFLANEDGSVTLNGTATASVGFSLHGSTLSSSPLKLPKGVWVTVSSNSPNVQFGVQAITDSGLKVLAVVREGSKKFFTEHENYYVYLYVSEGQEVNNETVYPQIEIGEEATKWVPYVNPESVTLSKYGKNIAAYDSGVAKGTGPWLNKNFRLFFPSGKYVISCNFEQTGYFAESMKSGISVKDEATGTLKLGESSTNNKKETLSLAFEVSESQIYRVSFFGNQTNNELESEAICEFTNIQLEVDNGTGLPTEFEKIKKVDYTPNADGTVKGVTSLASNMTLMTDTENTYVDVTYNRDINKALEEVKRVEETENWKNTPVLTIEVTEQCTAIDVTEIDGKAFEFSELAGYAQLVTNSANEGRLAILLNRTGSGTSAHGLVCLHASGATTEAATMKGVFEVKKEYGMWRTSNVGSNATTWLAMNAQRYEHWDSRDVFADVESITSFRLIPYSGNFNAGTVIKIYGKVVKV